MVQVKEIPTVFHHDLSETKVCFLRQSQEEEEKEEGEEEEEEGEEVDEDRRYKEMKRAPRGLLEEFDYEAQIVLKNGLECYC